ncbi:MAG: hypothetical protein R2762_28540 [Bryobacteraceae bacterium]
MTTYTLTGILMTLGAAATAFGQAAASRGPLVLDLRAGLIYDLGAAPNPSRTPTTYTMPFATVQMQANRACPETPFMARVDMNLNPAGQQAAARVFVNVEYEGASQREPKLPVGWVTHIGDDPNNDGFGGGSGLDGVAEVQVLDQNLAVYSAAVAAGVVDRIVYQEQAISKGSHRFEIANQFLGWGQPASQISTNFGKKLFAVGTSAGTDPRIYAGFNRVVRNGSTRTGCGARLVVIEFQ